MKSPTIRVTPAGLGQVHLTWVRPWGFTPLSNAPVPIMAALKTLASLTAMGSKLTLKAALVVAASAQ